jgi:hypothetical protein
MCSENIFHGFYTNFEETLIDYQKTQINNLRGIIGIKTEEGS